MAGFLKVLLRNVLDGPSTDPFPLGETFTPQRFRGKVLLDEQSCMGCGICVHTCAAGAINITQRSDGSGYDFTVWHNSCCLCASCRHYCPVKAITLTTDWHNAHSQEEKFQWVEQKFIPYTPCANCGTPIRLLSRSMAEKIYINNKDVDIDHILGLCPACRQLEDAARVAALMGAAKVVRLDSIMAEPGVAQSPTTERASESAPAAAPERVPETVPADSSPPDAPGAA